MHLIFLDLEIGLLLLFVSLLSVDGGLELFMLSMFNLASSYFMRNSNLSTINIISTTASGLYLQKSITSCLS